MDNSNSEQSTFIARDIANKASALRNLQAARRRSQARDQEPQASSTAPGLEVMGISKKSPLPTETKLSPAAVIEQETKLTIQKQESFANQKKKPNLPPLPAGRQKTNRPAAEQPKMHLNTVQFDFGGMGSAPTEAASTASLHPKQKTPRRSGINATRSEGDHNFTGNRRPERQIRISSASRKKSEIRSKLRTSGQPEETKQHQAALGNNTSQSWKEGSATLSQMTLQFKSPQLEERIKNMENRVARRSEARWASNDETRIVPGPPPQRNSRLPPRGAGGAGGASGGVGGVGGASLRTSQNQREERKETGLGFMLPGFTTTAEREQSLEETKDPVERARIRAREHKRRSRSRRDEEQQPEEGTNTSLRRDQSGQLPPTGVTGRVPGQHTRALQRAKDTRNRSSNRRNEIMDFMVQARRNRNQQNPSGPGLTELLGQSVDALAPSDTEQQASNVKAANDVPPANRTEMTGILREAGVIGQTNQFPQPQPGAGRQEEAKQEPTRENLEEQRAAIQNQIQTNFATINRATEFFNRNVQQIRNALPPDEETKETEQQAFANAGQRMQDLQSSVQQISGNIDRIASNPLQALARPPLGGNSTQTRGLGGIGTSLRSNAEEIQNMNAQRNTSGVRAPRQQVIRTLFDDDQPRDTPLMREVEELIRPGGGLQVMEPSTSAVNANSGNPLADDVFEQLRHQLDDIQSNVRRAAPVQQSPRGGQSNLISSEDIVTSTNISWRDRAMINHQRDGGRGLNRFDNNPRLYGHTRANRNPNRQQLTNLRELRRNMENFDSMLDEIDRFQQQTESLVRNLQAIDQAMGDRELEPVDDEPDRPKGLSEEDLGKQKIYNFDSKVHKLQDSTCSICIMEITDSDQSAAGGKTMVCTLTCGHSFHAPCVLGWLTKQSHCCPNCRTDLRSKK